MELWYVFIRDDAPAEDDNVLGVAVSQQLGNARKQRHVSAREHRQADTVNILLDGGLDNLFGGLMQA